MPIAVLKNKFILLFTIIFGTYSLYSSSAVNRISTGTRRRAVSLRQPRESVVIFVCRRISSTSCCSFGRACPCGGGQLACGLIDVAYLCARCARRLSLCLPAWLIRSFPSFHRPDRFPAAASPACLLITLLITVLFIFLCLSSGCICVFVCVLNCVSCCHYAIIIIIIHCHRLITHCSHFLLNFQLPTGFVLVGLKNNNNNN